MFIFTLVVASLYDLRYKKTPNLLAFTIVILGLAGNTFLNNRLGLIGSFHGLVIGFLCSWFFYLVAGLGAGDVKLITAIGSVVGYPLILFITAYSYVISAILGIFYINLWLPWYQNRRLESVNNHPQTWGSQRIPMAPGISIATFYLLYTQH